MPLSQVFLCAKELYSGSYKAKLLQAYVQRHEKVAEGLSMSRLSMRIELIVQCR